MDRRLVTSLVVVLLLAARATVPSPTEAGVAVIANRTARSVLLRFVEQPSKEAEVSVDPYASVAIPIAQAQKIAYEHDGQVSSGQITPGNAYALETSSDKTASLRRLLDEEIAAPAAHMDDNVRTVVLNVRVLVDDEEPGSQRSWEKRVRHRFALASALLERDCRVQLKVVEVGTWESDDNLIKLADLLRDFEQKVPGRRSTLTIGFSTQHVADAEQPHLGVTRSPLHTHILIGEGSSGLSEAERLEVLVHELGHYLGAQHCQDRASVMRSQLGDRQARSTRFRLGLDPLNLLAMNLVADDLRSQAVKEEASLSAGTKSRLQKIYEHLEPVSTFNSGSSTSDGEPAPVGQGRDASASVSPLIKATREVIAAIHVAAQANVRVRRPLAKDALAELYVRTAAQCANELPGEVAAPAFLRGLAIACDRDSFLRTQPLTKSFCEEVENEATLRTRLAVVGEPTLHQRSDLWQHFTVSMYLTSAFGAGPAEAAGLAKELADSRGGSGFSFADLQADFTGIVLAERVLKRQRALEILAQDFSVASYMTPVTGLDEGLSEAELRQRFGETFSDGRFRQAIKDSRDRVVPSIDAQFNK